MKKRLTVIAVFSVAFLSLIRGTLGPGMSLLYNYYNDYSPSFVSLVITLPSLAVIPSSFIFGKITGVCLKYKTAVIFTNLFLLIGGVGPCFYDNIYVLMGLRILFGLGVGIAIAIHKPLILEYSNVNHQKKYLGYSTVVASIGMIFFQSLVGFLSQYHRDTIFLAYLPIVLTTILAFLLPDVESHQVVNEQKILLKKQFNKKIYLIIFVYLVINLTATCFGINQTVMLLEKGFKNVALGAALLSNVQSCFSMISGLLFGKMTEHLKSSLIYMMLIGSVIALALIIVSKSYLIILIAMAMFGFTYNIIILYIFIMVANLVGEERKALAGGYMGVAAGIGGFLATGLMQVSVWLTGEMVYSVILFFILLLIVMILICRYIEG